MPLVSNRSFGFGAGITVTTAGVNVLLPNAYSGFRLQNRSANPVYVLVNLQIDDLAPVDWPATSVAIPTVKSIPGLSGLVETVTLAQALERGIQLLSSDPPLEIRGLGAFNAGPQIVHISLLSTGGNATVTGGAIDLTAP